MRQRPAVVRLGLALMLVLTFSFACAGQPSPEGDPNRDRRINRLVNQLGGDSFLEREEARKELEAIGAPALPALRKAIQQGDIEMSRRAAELIRVIEEKTLSTELLTPKKVHLKVTDMPVLDAVDKLAKLSGYTVRIDGDRNGLSGKRITLDTGEVTFWEALDRLNEKAGLAEKVTIASQPTDPNGTLTRSMYIDAVTDFLIVRGERKKKVMRPQPPPLKLMKLPKRQVEKKDDDKTAPDAKPDEEVEPKQAPVLRQEILDRLDALLVKVEQTKEIQDGIGPVPLFKGGLPAPPITPGRVILAPTTATKQYVSYAGAARVVLKHPKAAAAKPQAIGKHYDLILEVSAEPRLLGFRLSGVPSIAKAIDEHGQALSFLIDPPAPPKKEAAPVRPGLAIIDDIDINDTMFGRQPVPTQPSVTVRLQQGDKAARRLKELAGSLTAQVLVPDSKLATVDNILKAKGKSAEIKGGGRLLVDLIEKTSDSEYRVVMKLENLPGSANGGPNFAVNGKLLVAVNGGFGDYQPLLVDAKGNALTFVGVPSLNQEADPMTNMIIKTRVDIRYRVEGKPDHGPPARLVLMGTYVATVAVPFRFVDVPLP